MLIFVDIIFRINLFVYWNSLIYETNFNFRFYETMYLNLNFSLLLEYNYVDI